MLTKLAFLLHGKLLAAAVAGIVLVGGGTAVAVAASNGALPSFNGATTSPHDANDDHGGDATKTPGNDDQHERHGVASNIGANSFTLTPTSGSPITVTVSSQTVFHDLSGLSALKNGEQVEVKGSLQSNGTFAATDVEATAGDDNDNDDDNGNLHGAAEARGNVASLGSSSFVITIISSEGEGNSSAHAGEKLIVTVSSATTFKDLSGFTALRTGDQVEVKGTIQADGTLAATSVERSSEGNGGGDDGSGGHGGSGNSGDGNSGSGSGSGGGNGSGHDGGSDQ